MISLDTHFFFFLLKGGPPCGQYLSTCSTRKPVRSSLVLALMFFFFFSLFAISLYQIHQARLVRSLRLTGHELYVISVFSAFFQV